MLKFRKTIGLNVLQINILGLYFYMFCALNICTHIFVSFMERVQCFYEWDIPEYSSNTIILAYHLPIPHCDNIKYTEDIVAH